MGVPTSEVDYTIAATRRENTKIHKNMWWHWKKKKFFYRVTNKVERLGLMQKNGRQRTGNFNTEKVNITHTSRNKKVNFSVCR
jgi:hypothetical protein